MEPQQQLIDVNLKTLIAACKETGNFRKVSSTCLILISNYMQEIGIHLGLRPRLKEREYNFVYMQNINTFIHDNLELVLIPKILVERLKTIELLFQKYQGGIPLEYTKDLIEIYYELRKIEVPDLSSLKMDEGMVVQNEMGVLQSFYSGGSKKESGIDIKGVYLQKLSQKEQKLHRSLEHKYDKRVFENALMLRKLKHRLKEDTSKITIQTALSENMVYRISLQYIIGYFYLGCALAFLMLSTVLILESVFVPSLTLTVSTLLLAFLPPAVICFLIYWNNFHKQEGGAL